MCYLMTGFKYCVSNGGVPHQKEGSWFTQPDVASNEMRYVYTEAVVVYFKELRSIQLGDTEKTHAHVTDADGTAQSGTRYSHDTCPQQRYYWTRLLNSVHVQQGA